MAGLAPAPLADSPLSPPVRGLVERLGAFALAGGSHRLQSVGDTLSAPLPAPQPLPPAHKIALYASGLLQVGQKAQRFAFLPGFYRTFATREHALLCQVRPRPIWRIARWPADEVGLWYAFWTASQLTAVTPGQIDNGQQHLPALAITYCPADPPGSRQPATTTLYLAFLNEQARSSVLADLLADWPPAPTMELTP
ncbi:MAG: hypothetical protein NTV69_09310 [Caldilinea sp.]|nr:hypothetical protein [Caldilinea sp.]